MIKMQRPVTPDVPAEPPMAFILANTKPRPRAATEPL